MGSAGDSGATSPLSLFLAGDAMIVRPWSGITDPAFLRLVDAMRAASAAIVNLETVIHAFRGYAQADSGGTYMASPPEIASELRWAGVALVSHANNHAFDYGSEGIVETLEHAAAAGLAVAGTGRDLEEARAPRFVSTPAGAVGLVSMAMTFVPYGRASHSRPDLHGRPGLNPLRTAQGMVMTVTPDRARFLRRLTHLSPRRAAEDRRTAFRFLGIPVVTGASLRLERGRRLDAGDRDANLAAIREAAARSDIAVAAIHAHGNGRFVRGVARAAIDQGAKVVVIHGPHEVRGVELHGGGVIVHSLGDFVLEADAIERLPSDLYEKAGLGPESTAGDLRAATVNATSAERKAFDGCAAIVSFETGRLASIRLIPVDLGFDREPGERGRPRWADAVAGRRIIGRIAESSRLFGTAIRFDEASREGVVGVA